MNINLLLDNIVFNLQKAGGISVYWKELIQRILLDKNIDYNFFEYDNVSENIFRKKLEIHNKNIIKLSSKFTINFSRYINLKFSRSKPTIFHSSYYRICRGKNIINIVTLHDFIYEKKIHKLSSIIHIIQKRNALFRADGIICISENTKLDLLELYPKLSKKKIKVIYNGLNKDSFYPIQNRMFTKNVVFVGGRQKYKNFYSAVDIVSKLRDTNLVIVGNALSLSELDYLQNKLNKRFFHFLNLSTEELNVLYNNSICLLYLSEYEGFGLPILEAMAAGCPVIALKKSSIPEVAGNAALLYENVHDENIPKDIIKLQNNNIFRNNLVNLGYNNVQRFSWDNTFHDVKEFYLQLLKGKN
jgi:mannosyltransferase